MTTEIAGGRPALLEVVTIVEHGLACAGCDDPLEPGATAVRTSGITYFHDDTECTTPGGRYAPPRLNGP